jgi:hypothetical protein
MVLAIKMIKGTISFNWIAGHVPKYAPYHVSTNDVGAVQCTTL